MRRTVRVAVVALGVALTVCACGSNAMRSDGRMGSITARSDVDPQVLQDVVDAAFMVPGPDMLRAMRVDEFGRQKAIQECGGQPGPIDSTAGRMDQSRFPDLNLIRRRGFTDQLAVEAEDQQLEDVGDACTDLAPDIASFSDWSELRAPWLDTVETIRQDPSLAPLKSRMASCLTTRTGLAVDPVDPTAYLRAVNAADADGATKSEMALYAVAYADCGTQYFKRIRTLLLAERPAMVERHREVLQRYAVDIAEAGYVP